MRRLFTTDEALAWGLSRDALRWGVRTGRWRRVERGVYAMGPEDPSDVDRARARVVAAGAVASGALAGVLHDLDSVALAGNPIRRRRLAPERIVIIEGIRCADGLQTLIDLAAILDDLQWEQTLESALRTQLTRIVDLDAILPSLTHARTPGTARIRRVLAVRPSGAPPTESLLETLMVQLARLVPGLEDPVRQLVITSVDGHFIARVDLAWPEIGLFIELDGQQHKGQPIYDASRQTAVVAVTGWLVRRFSWHEVTQLPTTTARRLVQLVDQARQRKALPL